MSFEKHLARLGVTQEEFETPAYQAKLQERMQARRAKEAESERRRMANKKPVPPELAPLYQHHPLLPLR